MRGAAGVLLQPFTLPHPFHVPIPPWEAGQDGCTASPGPPGKDAWCPRRGWAPRGCIRSRKARAEQRQHRHGPAQHPAALPGAWGRWSRNTSRLPHRLVSPSVPPETFSRRGPARQQPPHCRGITPRARSGITDPACKWSSLLSFLFGLSGVDLAFLQMVLSGVTVLRSSGIKSVYLLKEFVIFYLFIYFCGFQQPIGALYNGVL